jgi:hypothetical protein
MINPLPVPEELLSACVKETFGSTCCLVAARSLVDGTRKKVLLLELSHPPGKVVLLAWQNEHDYFGEREVASSPLNDWNAPSLYRANTALLTSHHLRVPSLYYYNDSRHAVPFTFALVEYVQADTFNTLRQNQTSARLGVALNRMRVYLTRMHRITRACPGNVFSSIDAQQYLDNLLPAVQTDLAGLAAVHPGVGNIQRAVWDKLTALHAQMTPRDCFSFIHGELGPDEHFLIDSHGEIVILDVDGCEFADLEREYAYLKLRFGDFFPTLSRADLDPIRMQFYGLCLHISAAYGHYRLLAGGYSGEPALQEIFESNAAQVIQLCT